MMAYFDFICNCFVILKVSIMQLVMFSPFQESRAFKGLSMVYVVYLNVTQQF